MYSSYSVERKLINSIDITEGLSACLNIFTNGCSAASAEQLVGDRELLQLGSAALHCFSSKCLLRLL